MGAGVASLAKDLEVLKTFAAETIISQVVHLDGPGPDKHATSLAHIVAEPVVYGRPELSQAC